MKKLIITTILLILSISLYSQVFLDESKSDIVFNKGKPTGVIVNDTLNSISYESNTRIELYYFDDNDNCVTYSIIEDITYLGYYLKLMNESYNSISSGIWTYQSDNIEVYVELYTSDKQFMLIFVLIDDKKIVI